MFMPKFALLMVLGYATITSTHSPSTSHTSTSTKPPANTKATISSSSLARLSSSKAHAHSHTLHGTAFTTFTLANGTNTTLYGTGTGTAPLTRTPSLTSLTPSTTSDLCPTHTTTIAHKRCPQIRCGPRPAAQLGGGIGIGNGGAVIPPQPDKRCVLESTTTIPCGCPTVLPTKTVLGGCSTACPPQGCQIDWVTAVPRGCR
ncbi:hypothetical protein ACLMJK_001994 [Lecanora helva]